MKVFYKLIDFILGLIVYKLCLRFHIPVAVPFVVLPVCAVAVGCGLHVLIERPLLRLIPRRKPRLWASA